MAKKAIREGNKRNPAVTRAAILQAALEEFSEVGHSGARVDSIARRAGVSKPMLYDYFGDKDAIYAAALREAYVQIREAEQKLDLARLTPEAAVRQLVVFTMRHFLENPWFIRILNTENLRGGDTVRAIEDAEALQSVLLTYLEEVLERGRAAGDFHADIGAARLYILIASVCYFPVSNSHTLRAAFGAPIDEAWLMHHADTAADMVLVYLRTPPAAG